MPKSLSEKNKVKKAVIPVAGLGTRFLPVTKTIPKEMLPIVDTPILFYIIDEAVRAGIEDIILIAGRGKTAIEDFFDTSYELEDTLEKLGKTDILNMLLKIKNSANIISIRQKEAKGLGHAVLCSQPVVGHEAFALLLGDEIMFNKPAEPTTTQQMIQHYQQSGISTVAVMNVEKSEVSKYGIVKTSSLNESTYKVLSVVEKPKMDEAPSQLALPGRYVFNSAIFKHLQATPVGRNGEIQLTDAMTLLAQNEGLHASLFNSTRYDAGDKFGYLVANIEYGLRHPDISEKMISYIKTLSKSL